MSLVLLLELRFDSLSQGRENVVNQSYQYGTASTRPAFWLSVDACRPDV
jgi:hypothetical protein